MINQEQAIKQYTSQVQGAGLSITEDQVRAKYDVVLCTCNGGACPGWKMVKKVLLR